MNQIRSSIIIYLASVQINYLRDKENVGHNTDDDMIVRTEDCQCPLKVVGPTIVDSPICSGLTFFMILLEGYIRGRCNIATPCSNVESVEKVEPDYDFIVVGAGAGGSVVAGRLSEHYTVLLLEAGGSEPTGARIPSFYRAFWRNEEVDWGYRTVPSDYCLDQKGKGCYWPRGKVVGGSNVLNGMMYHRGHPADYDDWVAAGAEGWSWEENQQYFDLNENNKQAGSVVDEEYHSTSGVMPIQQFPYQPPFLYEIIAAINETSIPVIADMNNPNTPEGFMIAQAMTENGQRVTSARAYLKPKSQRPNLSLKTNVHVAKVLFDEASDGWKAVGVEYIDEDGNTQTVKANKEVILSAGALNTPHILMLSGIGPKEILNQYNIPVLSDLPVGKNLQNHYGTTLYFLLTEKNNTEVLDWSVFMDYVLTADGPMSSTAITQLTGLLYSSLADRSRLQPDIQVFFNGFYAECSKTGAIDEVVGEGDCYKNGYNISVNAAILQPRGVGYLTLQSTDPLDPPLFYPGYFEEKDDIIMLRDATRYLQEIFETDRMKKWGAKLDPKYTEGCQDSGSEWSDAWIDCMARLNTDPQNHQLGTAAMGLVTDPQLRVKGVSGLRVMDASAIPSQVTGNPQAAIMMLAERGAANLISDWS